MRARLHRIGGLPALALCLLLQACALGSEPAGASGPPVAPPRTQELAGGRVVVAVSLDGLGCRVRARADTPHLDRLAARGVDAPLAQTVLPSSTLPSHVSMVTGLTPEHHGMRFNSLKVERGAVDRPTVFGWVRAAGGHTGLVVAKKKLHFHLAADGDLESREKPGWGRKRVIEAAVARLRDWSRDGRGGFLLVHFADVDGAGHEHGWESEAQLAIAARVDAALGRLVEAVEASPLAGRVSWIVTADHGGKGTSHGGDTPEEREVPFVMAGAGIAAGAGFEGPVSVMDVAPTAARLLGVELPGAALDGRSHTEVLIASGSGEEAVPVPAALAGAGAGRPLAPGNSAAAEE